MRLLVIEDNVRLAALMAQLMVDNGQTADVAGSLEEARAALSLVDYDIVLLDLSLPDGDGRDILNAIRQSQRNAFVLVVTARGDVVNRVQVLNAGADDYIVKPFSDDELIARVRALGRRPRQIRDDVLSAGNLRLDTGSLTLTVSGRAVTIPRRELSVLSALLSQQGKVLRREKLDKAVYSLGSEVSDNAVEAAVSRLRRRLEGAGATVDIVAMRGIGYILTERASC
ncbi:MAG: response regulator transcription factor [Alphaproteobacteria bacterium]|nr:response regulator transcription factor [Alphaproteobacteria bacterium]MDE2494599.1 response regulator transcription factor [Alphaproteobacteria bacterium]